MYVILYGVSSDLGGGRLNRKRVTCRQHAATGQNACYNLRDSEYGCTDRLFTVSPGLSHVPWQ
ncbi:MAG: hypothetical protein WCG31_02535 [Deltaproteobacteria bacterium]